MNSPEKRDMDKYFKDQLDNNLDAELKIFDNILAIMVNVLACKYSAKCKSQDDIYSVIFDHWECFSEVLPPYREVKWNFMRIKKYREVAEKKGYGQEALDQEEIKIREKCILSMLWFEDILAYSAGLIKEDLRAKRLFGLDD